MSQIEEHIAALQSEDETDRCYAAEDLSYINDPQVVEPLIERLKIDQSRIVKEALIVALERLQIPEVLEPLAKLFDHEDPFVRNGAVGILQKKGAHAIPMLLEKLDNSDPDIRKFALDTLTIIELDLANSIYGKALNDADINVRITAVEYVGTQRKTQFKPLVEKIFLESNSSMLQSACLQTLCLIGDQTSVSIVLQKYPDDPQVPSILKETWKTLTRTRATSDPQGTP